jgi:hypothetical protein
VAVVATAASGVGGTVAYKLFHSPTAPIWITWWHWFASDAVGIIIVAPLAIGLVKALREPPPRNETLEGVVALVVLAVMTVIIVSLPPEPWEPVAPVAVLFPILLWITSRCQPVFAAVAAFIVSLAIMWTTTFGIGHFGHPVLPIDDRILRAQAAILSVALCAYIVAALFAERRRHEGLLQEALAAGAVMAFECNPISGMVQRSENAAQILGLGPSRLPPAPNSLSGFIETTSRALRRTITGPASTAPPRSPFVSFAPTAGRCGSKKPHGRTLTRRPPYTREGIDPRYHQAEASWEALKFSVRTHSAERLWTTTPSAPACANSSGRSGSLPNERSRRRFAAPMRREN